jgi:thiosulfate/3-mercaptopyruvate sulfurtransferase
VLTGRGGKLDGGPLEQGYNTHCASCHASCGQCHVSRPTAVGGGLLAGHQFKKTPPMKETCTSCHVTRVGQEFLGENEGIEGDVHWAKAAMLCSKCHGKELHAASKEGDHRYTKAEGPQCLNCHAKVKPGGSGIPQHDLHGDKLSCQVCHSVQYKNCSACHVGKDDKGVKYFKTAGTEMDFKIGLNPLPSPERPYKYVTVRHAPASPQGFDFYAKNLQPNFDALPTWKYATPHNIQRKTPQNSSCNACHGNAELFLTAEDVKPAEREANQKVIVPTVPKAR